MRGTIVLMMAVERIGAFADALVRHGRPADTPVVIVQDAHAPGSSARVRATLADAAQVAKENDVSPPAIVVVGPVAGLGDELPDLLR